MFTYLQMQFTYTYIKLRFLQHMKKDVDFSKLETVERLKVFQKALHRELKEKYK